ncbi:MAG: VWA domain-containing protein [Candidatus Omnitrophota bacterium]|jgi:Ca-activated chloride channel family protein|nr:MAG: VWA domain-containing protein [Candidatus Omnitrophota bacterium]
MRFAYQGYLLLLLLTPFLWWRYVYRKGAAPILYSDIRRIKQTLGMAGGHSSLTHFVRHVLFGVRLLVLTLFILALARPQAELLTSDIYTEGVDIMLTVDVSGSMNFIDLDVQNMRTRLEVTKEAVKTFVDGRRYDRIGMIVFASDAFLQCPLTVDYGIVKNFLDDVRIGMIPENSTAVGNAVASALNRLRHAEAKSKVIVLLTDGANNAGQIDPLTAAEMAKALNVKLYTIGVGGKGVPLVLREDIFGRHPVPYPDAERVDEATLTKMAEMTYGKYFRATDRDGLNNIFREIDQMEKSKIISEGLRRFRELFHYFLIPALILLLMEVVLTQTRFRKLP